MQLLTKLLSEGFPSILEEGHRYADSRPMFPDSCFFPLREQAILKIKMLCNVHCVKVKLRLQCKKLSTAHQSELRSKAGIII